ncbi:MAG: filamentous hemagglutinin N-terminal domain-containing protein [Candidatus Rhabdochlamydia sp.]
MKKIVLSLFLYSITAYAAPEGFELMSGQATAPQINAQGQIQIQSTQDSVVHWNSFSLNPQEVLVFDQAQETSSILNRVVGSDPSEILGKILSNGMVYLINQNGILIGPGGVIETAGFLASTLDVLNTDFFTKNTLEFFSKNPGSIINLGTISCPVGQVTLLAQSIENQGEIDGSLQAVTCTKATLQIDNQRVFIQTNQEIDTPDSFQSLSKSIQKNPYAHAIKHSGRITANTLGVENGRIYLFAQEGTTEITGSVEASDIKLLGKEVLLKEQAIIDASSDTQGGKVLIGGGYKGQDIDIPLAEHVLIDSEVQIHADAKQTGNGGEIIIWSEENTGFLGSLSAKGGDLSGDGGFIEVSGKKGLTFEGLVDLTATHGKTGYLLIDPDNINIIPTGTDPATGQTFNTVGNVNISGNNISSALNSANLVLQANLDIVIGDDIINTSTNDLTLQAGGNITSSGGQFTLQLNGGDFTAIFNDAGAANSGGAASFVANNLTIETSDGKIVIQQGNLNDQYQGTIFLQKECLLDARTGSIELTLHSNNNGEGIKLDSSNIVAGDVILNGIGSAGIDSNVSSIQANNSIHSIGIAKANDKPGINLVDSVFWVKNTGDIILNGQAADSSGLGISLLQSAINPQLASKILTENGSVTLNSIRGSIQLDNASIDCRGSGVLTVNSQQDCSLLGSLHPCVMEVGSGIADFTIGRDLTLSSTNIFTQVAIASNKENLTGGSLQFTVERNVSLLATDTSSLCLIGFSTVSNAANVAGDILFHHVGGDLILEGANNIGPGNFGFAQIGHISFLSLTEPVTLNGNISLLVDGSISLVGGSASETSYAQIGHGGLYPFITTGQVTAIAGKNIVMQSNTGSANIINKGGDVTLVTDNLFPVSPLIGPGFFAINSTVSASGELRIYTATRSQNQINDLINGSPFTPGTLFVDSNEEIWSTYYLGGGYGGGPFTIYYKEPPIVPPIVPPIEVIEETFQFALDQAELSTMLQNFYIVNPPIYQAKLDYFSQRELMCFDPYRRVLRYRVNQKNLTN